MVISMVQHDRAGERDPRHRHHFASPTHQPRRRAHRRVIEAPRCCLALATLAVSAGTSSAAVVASCCTNDMSICQVGQMSGYVSSASMAVHSAGRAIVKRTGESVTPLEGDDHAHV